MAQRFNYGFQPALGTHPPPPPPQLGGGGPPFPVAVGDYRIYISTRDLFLPYNTYHVLTQQVYYYQYQDFSRPHRQAQQHYYNVNNTRSRYSNVHNSDRNRVQFEDETLILDGSVVHRQQHERDHQDQRAAVNNIQRRDDQNNKSGLSENQITRCLEIKKDLRRADKEAESEVCAICLDDLCRLGNNRSIETRDNKNVVGSLECKHQYHWDCIRRWLRVKNFCPLCKAVAFHHQDAR